MTQDEIIKMAKQAGFSSAVGKHIALDDDLERFAKLVAQHEREACVEIADRLPRIYRETEEAHYRFSPEPFKPSQFGFDYAELRQAESITNAIRARGQA